MHEYQEIEPSKALRQFVEHYWFRSFPDMAGEGQYYDSVPHADIEFTIHIKSGQGEFSDHGNWKVLPKATLKGITTGPTKIRVEGPAKIMGIRFTVEGFARLFDIPVHTLTDHSRDTSQFLQDDIERLIHYATRSVELPFCIELTELFLFKKIRELPRRRTYLSEAPELIRKNFTQFSLDAISTELSIGGRQLQRSFVDTYGVGPKAYQCIVRFNKTYRYIMQQKQPNWTAIACDFGYADQAHLIRDFQKFMGTSPNMLKSSKEIVGCC